MKKTPMQEFLEDMDACKVDFFVDEDKWLQKEKAFAFDCFKAGMMHNHDQMICSSFQHETTFDKFYSQYAEQHNK